MDLTALFHRTIIVTNRPAELATHLYHQLTGSALVLADAPAQLTGLRDTVVEEICFGLEQRGISQPDMHSRATAIMDALAITSLAHHNPTQLSGGQTKRVALAAVAVIAQPILILDEPFAGLDATSARRVAKFLEHYDGQVIVVTSNPNHKMMEGQWLSDDGHELQPFMATYQPKLPEPTQQGSAVVLLDQMVQGTRPCRERKWWRKKSNQPEFTTAPTHIRVESGTVTWLRGANGAGKTTILRTLCGLGATKAYKESEAAITMSVQRAQDQAIEPTMEELIGSAQACQNLSIDPQEHPLDATRSDLRIAQVASVLLGDWPIVALDEPDVDLSPHGREQLYFLLADALTQGKGIIMTCHDAHVMEEIATFAPVKQTQVETTTSS